MLADVGSNDGTFGSTSRPVVTMLALFIKV